jgi:hypothetical protein
MNTAQNKVSRFAPTTKKNAKVTWQSVMDIATEMHMRD